MTATARFDIRQWLDPEARVAFDQSARKVRYAAGRLIYRQGDEGHEMYQVQTGSIRLSSMRGDGREVVFLFFGPGDCFGNSSMVDFGPRPQTAEALEDTELGVLAKPAFDRLRDVHPSFIDAIARLLARQMRVVADQFVDVSLDSLPVRIAGRILQTARVLTHDQPRSSDLVLRLPQSEIGSLVGASRQSVNRVLQRLQECGLIRIEYNTVVVRDPTGLERLASSEGLSNL